MKKTISIVLTTIILIGAIGTTAIKFNNTNESTNEVKKTIRIDFSEPTFTDSNDNYIRLGLGYGETYIMNPGQPMLPRILKTFELPPGISNIKVEVNPNGIQKMRISKQILPVPIPKPLSPIPGFVSPPKKDLEVYNSKELFPKRWFSYRVGCGLSKDGDHVTHLAINIFPVRYAPAIGEIWSIQNAELRISYEEPAKPISFPDVYDLVIISPKKFSNDLDKLVIHKNNLNVRTILNTTDEIYSNYEGVDKPEQIKYFIKDAIEKWGIKYVLLVGGLKSLLLAKPRDHKNYGTRSWYIPVRYSNLIHVEPGTPPEPGYLCDLYYADIYKWNNDTQEWEFDDWNSNGNDVIAEWNDETRDLIDLYPDVSVGRLACRNRYEVKTVVNKIINYETTADPSWFNSMIVVSGDGFLDQEDWNITWDTNGLPDGEYTIHAQSSNPEGETGPIDNICITLDKTVETNITFNHDDHLKEELHNGYPAPPIAEIVSISNNNTLGNTNYNYTPHDGEAYCNELYWWANISYVSGVLTIRGKSYDPKPYGNISNLKLWITNENEEVIFTEYRNNTLTYYEGEWVTGEKLVHNRGGALYYMPEDFEKEIVWTSNGKFACQSDVIESFSKGHGLAYFAGHGSPGVWCNHLPGLPGNRRYSQIMGLVVTQGSFLFPYVSYPVLPMRKLSNKNENPVVVVGGCHNSMFGVSLIPTFIDIYLLYYFNISINMHTYGHPIPECWSWYLVKLPKTGAIATIGNTGFGWGSEGEWCTIGVGDGWISTEFFKQYSDQYNNKNDTISY